MIIMDKVISQVRENEHKEPKATTLIEEMAEFILACRGKHEHPIELELYEIASIAINLIRQAQMGVEINDIIRR